MGTKYSTNTTSGYNATPPADDGTVSEANKVKYSTIKTKLADPVKDRGDTINTELVEHFDQGPDTHSTAHTTVAGDYNTVLEVTGTTTISLLDASTATAGYFVTVVNVGSNTVTVDLTTGTDTLDGTVDGSKSLAANDGATFIVNSAADGYFTIASSLGGLTSTSSELNILDGTVPVVQENLQIYSGYVDDSVAVEVLPSGWTVTNPTTGNYTITHNLGLSAPVSDLIVTVTAFDALGVYIAGLTDRQANTFSVRIADDTGSLSNQDFYFHAIQRVV